LQDHSNTLKEQLIDIVSKLKEGKITFDEIYEEFFNLSINTFLEVKKAFNEGTLADKIQFGLDVNELSEVQSKTRSKEEVIKLRQKALSEKQKAETALKDSVEGEQSVPTDVEAKKADIERRITKYNC